MTHTIGKYHRPSGTVQLTVEHQGVTFTRPVNAALDDQGNHDRTATRARAAAVARGLEYKIEKGLITGQD